MNQSEYRILGDFAKKFSGALRKAYHKTGLDLLFQGYINDISKLENKMLLQ